MSASGRRRGPGPLGPASLAALALLLCVGCAGPGAGTPPRPHILVVLVDDLGWRDTSLQVADGPAVPFRTPAVERLAARGTTFTQAYAAAPVCTPTRISLLTGASPARHGTTYWILHAGQDTSSPWPGYETPPWNVDGLQPGTPTLPGLLRDQGYRTVHVGKAHLGALGTPGADPTTLGFDVNIAGHGAGAPASYRGLDGFGKPGGSVWDVPGLEHRHGEDVFLTDALADEALAQIDAVLDGGQRLFLHVAPYAVHTPLMAHPDHPYPGLEGVEATYASMVSGVDAALGRLLDRLEQRGVLDETLVVFTSDNGGLAAHTRAPPLHRHNGPLRGGKGSAYEGGLRVPLVIAWPGVTAPGSRSDVPVITMDLTATLAAAAGVDLPGGTGLPHRGRDLAPLLAGGAPRDEATFVWHQPHFWGVHGPGIWPFSAICQGDHKLIRRLTDGHTELYDLAADPGETTPLDDPELEARLAGMLEISLEPRDR